MYRKSTFIHEKVVNVLKHQPFGLREQIVDGGDEYKVLSFNRRLARFVNNRSARADRVGATHARHEDQICSPANILNHDRCHHDNREDLDIGINKRSKGHIDSLIRDGNSQIAS